MSFSHDERRRLADLLIAKGPEAPTLCEGWATRDLAAHLWIRENRPDAAAGMFVAAAQGHLETVTSQVLARPYDELVEAWAEGPGRFSPVRIVDRWMNLAEHFVHHEDVRRGQWMVDGTLVPARELSGHEQAALTKAVMVAPRFILRRASHPVQLRIPGRLTLDLHPKSAAGGVVTVTGEPGEVLLWVYGRDAAHVTIAPQGAPDLRRGL
ncbi:TIGR03085 family metal-binding protein [Trueperella abortisuis]|uniref:TIGR03085 family metal-binding protein n=1 Tax=Trueperella abortisuis TaxID=445930 RepID=UPI00289350E8|nr:TIGR03085 family metal-binding protein [Trueperella abortisuis]